MMPRLLVVAVRHLSLVSALLMVALPRPAMADPPLPGCLAHLLDHPPVCGGAGPNGEASDGCCPNDCTFETDADCCTPSDDICLHQYGCNSENDEADCCAGGDAVCGDGCSATQDDDCGPGADNNGTGGCSSVSPAQAAWGAWLPFAAVGLLLGIGLISRRLRTQPRG